jgi:hypothetical protein
LLTTVSPYYINRVKRKYTAKTLQNICDLLDQGEKISSVLSILKISPSLFKYWKDTFPEFLAAIEGAQYGTDIIFKEKALSCIEIAIEKVPEYAWKYLEINDRRFKVAGENSSGSGEKIIFYVDSQVSDSSSSVPSKDYP